MNHIDNQIIAEILSLEAEVERQKKAGAPLRAQLWQRLFDLANNAAAAGIEEFTTADGEKVKPRLKQKVVIRGGAKESTERQRVLEILDSLGLGADIVTYRDIRADALDKVWQSVPAESFQAMLEEGLIRVEAEPDVRIGRRKIGKDAEAES